MIELSDNRTRGTRYPQEVKELAYDVYAHRCEGDMPDTMAVLRQLLDPPLSDKTLWEWRKAYQWDKRLEAERLAVAPNSWELYFGGLAVAALEALTDLRSIVRNPDASDRDRIAADRTILAQVSSHIEQLEARMPSATTAALSPSMSDEELLALVTKGRDAGGGEAEEG